MNTVTPESPFILGPLQEAWLKALESGRWLQAKGTLCVTVESLTTLNFVYQYCCLGVANEVCGLGECWDHTSLNDTNLALGLRGDEGIIVRELVSPEWLERLDDAKMLTQLNDDRRWSFADIAAFIRANPTAVFFTSK